jgi:tetratricopeptide (TPR) repeat protein
MDLPNGLITDPYNSKNYCITGREYMDKGDYDAALRWFFSGIRANASDPELYSSIGDLFRERGQYDVARRWYQKGISIDSTFSQNYEGMGWLYIGKRQYKQALPWFKKALQVPQPHTLSPFRYEGIAHAFRDLRLHSEAMDFFRKEKRRNPLANDYLLMFKKRRIQKEVKQWIQQDIGRIISLCGRYNVRIILQNYPKEYLIDDMLRKVGNRHGIPFVDHNRVFSRILKEGVSREQYFVPDGHPNARGYGVMATNIYNTLQESNVLKFLKNP